MISKSPKYPSIYKFPSIYIYINIYIYQHKYKITKHFIKLLKWSSRSWGALSFRNVLHECKHLGILAVYPELIHMRRLLISLPQRCDNWYNDCILNHGGEMTQVLLILYFIVEDCMAVILKSILLLMVVTGNTRIRAATTAATALT